MIEFKEAMQAAGLDPLEPIEMSGSLIRFDIDAKGDKAGWYICHADGVPAGQFGNWKTGLSEKWCGKDQQTMTEAERAEHRRFNERAKAQREAQRLADQEQAATKARQRWEAARPANQAHPYLAQKHIMPHGTRQEGDKLLIPLLAVEPRVCTSPSASLHPAARSASWKVLPPARRSMRAPATR